MEYLIPRLLCAFFTGTLLSQVGSFLQLSSKNILASPSTLGFDGLSVLWILILHSIIMGFGIEVSGLAMVLMGLPVFVLIGLYFSKFLGKNKHVERLILLGITFNLLVGAIFSLWQFLFLAFNLPFPVELWFGHFRYADNVSLIVLIFSEIALLLFYVRLKNQFEILSLGRSLSKNLALKETKLYSFIFISISVITFLVVQLFGAFSFLALIFPLISRKVFFKRWDLSGEIFVGAMMNGLVLMLIDYICFEFPIEGAEVPVGLVATSVGALSLILILWKSTRSPEILAKTQK